MTSKLTRERIELIANFHRAMTLPPSHDEIEELARMALAAMDSEPMAEVLSNRPGNDTSTIDRALPVGTQLYRHAQPAKGLELAGWQFKSVNGDWLGLIDEHGKNQAVREGCEVREVFAMADGVNERDQAVNKQREWPEPKDGEPRLHIKEQPAPVVQENSDPRDAFEAAFPMPKHAQRCGDGYVVTSYGAWTAYEFVKKWEGWNACRAAMLNGGKS